MNKLVLSIILLFVCSAEAVSVKEIMNKNEEARKVADVVAEVVLKTTGPEGNDEKRFQYWRKLSDGKRFKTLTRFSAPASIRNQGILFLEQDEYRSDVFLYLPTFKKVRRVESHAQSSSFMGSAFSYSDIATPMPSDFNHKLLKEEKCPVEGQACYVVESIPKSEGVRERTGYAKSVLWIDTKNFMTVQWDFFDEKAQAKRMQATQIKPLGAGKYFAHQLKITNMANKKQTTLDFSDVSTKEKISDSTFTQQNLSRER